MSSNSPLGRGCIPPGFIPRATRGCHASSSEVVCGGEWPGGTEWLRERCEREWLSGKEWLGDRTLGDRTLVERYTMPCRPSVQTARQQDRPLARRCMSGGGGSCMLGGICRLALTNQTESVVLHRKRHIISTQNTPYPPNTHTIHPTPSPPHPPLSHSMTHTRKHWRETRRLRYDFTS